MRAADAEPGIRKADVFVSCCADYRMYDTCPTNVSRPAANVGFLPSILFLAYCVNMQMVPAHFKVSDDANGPNVACSAVSDVAAVVACPASEVSCHADPAVDVSCQADDVAVCSAVLPPYIRKIYKFPRTTRLEDV